MIKMVRTAAYAAVAMALTGALNFADPTLAWEGEAAPGTVRYTEHAAATIAADLPETFAAPPAPEATSEIEAPAQHAVATVGFDMPEAEVEPRSLSELVGEFDASETDGAEHECLATAVYFESKGEPLNGQLAVAEVVINRARSGRFPASLCGVVKQRGQFSFVRGGRLPSLPRASAQWKTAVAIARIAQQDLANSKADNALFFHARRVSPGWKKKRVATLGNHVFYR